MALKMLKPRLKTLDTRTLKTLSGTTRITGNRLQRIRRDHFRENPLCVACYAETPRRVTLATELDHVMPLWAGGHESDENRQGLCRQHHENKSALEAAQRGRGGL
jgi:5-methylcytosine-specific restriction protein A